ncbi:hypothetical protein EAH89_29115 [Roseomonas nepalensis]|uniref:Pentapeptide repeat-containing protein n=2 Tax=Muricoccus nepalensis TaxID=1854500 RepID=A0A502ESK1_9PROT|nr:hypothetical protein EAH89_29115 [Roseomonas nepalensis]
MAQFLNPRERRACLTALAELSTYGAKGIITSRPNYFTEKEEFTVFEALYENLKKNKIYMGKSDKEYIEKELAVDSLLERHVLNRFERALKDLSPAQTEALVSRKLQGDDEGKLLILSMLRRIFRDELSGERTSLSGKPVIISYLLELVDDLRLNKEGLDDVLTEWSVYKMIVDRLMLRDQQRAEIDPIKRRSILRKLAIQLSHKDKVVADEQVFHSIIEKDFRSELRRLPLDERAHRRQQIFEDLRSSSTLSRSTGNNGSVWVFSHNSLREFLSVEAYVESIYHNTFENSVTPISDAMRVFAASMPKQEFEKTAIALQSIWSNRRQKPVVGKYLSLLWHGFFEEENATLLLRILEETATGISIDGVKLEGISFSNVPTSLINAEESDLAGVNFSEMIVCNSNFVSSVMDSCSFRDSDLTGAKFSNSLIYECDFSNTIVRNAEFYDLEEGSSFLVVDGKSSRVVTGKDALGYLTHMGAKTSAVDSIYVYQYHRYFPIAEKIAERLVSNRNNQYLGLTQRGEARQNPDFARAFVELLKSNGLVALDKNKLVALVGDGRDVLNDMIGRRAMSSSIAQFFRENG